MCLVKLRYVSALKIKKKKRWLIMEWLIVKFPVLPIGIQ